MDAEVVSITKERSCGARLGNEVLVVFPEIAGHLVKLSDNLRFVELVIDADVCVLNLTTGDSFTVRVSAKNVHDLRLPAQHGGSRAPSPERLRGS
jgi:hypothetical protein